MRTQPTTVSRDVEDRESAASHQESAVREQGSEFQTIGDLAQDLSARRVTSEALTGLFLERIDRLDSKLQAFSEVYHKEAMEVARQRDQQREAGQARGGLHGVPIAIKDIFDYAGYATHAGSAALTDRLPQRSAASVRRLEAAGAIVLGKTRMTEFAFGGWGTNPIKGTPWNPWDLEVKRVPGGSSSGSAVAVAAGLAPAALGTDTGGSVRTPAGWCGLVGLKTSLGLISREGVVPLCPTHDTVGFMTRSVSDAALLLNVLTACDPDDPSTVVAPPIDSDTELEGGVKGLKIGVLSGNDLESVNAEIRDHFLTAARDLESLGAEVCEIRLPHSVEDYVREGGDIMSAESYAHLGSYAEQAGHLMDPAVRCRILQGRDISACRYLRLLQARWSAQVELRKVLEGFSAFLAPTCPAPPIPVDQVDENKAPNVFGRFVNFLELAALSIPVGLTGEGLPAGMQIVVRRFQDPMALRIGRALEQKRGGLVKRPPGL